MTWLNRLPIRWKLVVTTLMTSGMVVILASFIVALYENQTYRQQTVHDVAAAAQLVAGSVAAPLDFNDAKAAQENLDTLSTNPEIKVAAVYDASGALIAHYAPDGTAVPERAQERGRFSHDDVLAVYEPVIANGNKVGTVYIQIPLTPMLERLARYAGIMLVAIIASLLVAVPIAMRLSKTIYEPITQLADVATHIASGDLTPDIIPPDRPDEIGILIGAFGQMVTSLREMTGTLEGRVAERTAELQAANKELESFSYSVSHDLRAPLRAIDGFARMLEEDLDDRLDPESRRLLSVVRDSSRKMGQLIDDLLTFSKLGRQAMTLYEVDMTALVRSVWEDIADNSDEIVWAFDLKPLPNVPVDGTLLKQVWINLLSNAKKYSGKNPHPVVEVSGERNGNNVTYRVKDNGVGFDMRYYDKLFGVFQRLHTADEFPGTGVGLAIVQRVVLRHGGRVWAESRIGEGSIFQFSMPISRA